MFIAQYYYDKNKRMWKVDILDENNTIIYSEYTFPESNCINVINELKIKYDIISKRKIIK